MKAAAFRTFPATAFGWWRREIAGLAPAIRRRRTMVAWRDGRFDGPAGKRLTVLTPAAALLVRRIRAPSAAFGELPRIAELTVERDWPLADETPVWDWRIDHSASDFRHVEIIVAMARRTEIARICDAADDQGIRHLIVDGQDADGPLRLDLKPPDRRRGRSLARTTRVVGAIALCLIAALTGAGVLEGERETTAARAALAAARVAAQPALRARAELTAKQEALRALAAAVAAQGRLVEAVETIAAALPDSAWLTSMDIEGRAITLAGRSTEAAKALSRLENAPTLAGARFASPVLRDPRKGVDRFEITVSYGVTAPTPASASASGD